MVGLCRLCASLRKMDVLLIIKDNSHEICEMLRRCCELDIKMQDRLPKAICRECLEQLNKAHKFYAKVKEAQETLQALYPTSEVQDETGCQQEQPTLAMSLSSTSGITKKRKSSVLDQESSEESKTPEKLKEVPLKQIKFERHLISKVHDNSLKDIPLTTTNHEKEAPNGHEENVIQKVYDMLEMNKEECNYENSYDIIEAIEEPDADNVTLYNYPSQEQEQVVQDFVEDDGIHNPLAVNENDDIIELDYYEEEEEEDVEIISNMIEQSIKDGEEKKLLPSQTFQIKLNSWQHYKYLCFICENKSSSFIELRKHIAQHHNITQIDKIQYKCYECKKLIPRYNFFLNHIRVKHHPMLKLKCDACDLSCQNFKELSHHRSVNCSEASNYAHILPCNQCFKSFNDTCGFQNHCKVQHSSIKDKEKSQCMVCHKEFQYKSCLKAHEKLHSEREKFPCSLCKSIFYSKSSLEAHLYVHIDDKLYQCNICHKSFKTFLNLDQHQLIHSEAKPFQCDFCDKTFRKKIQKITHERSHTGEMPFPCAHCDKHFRYRSALNAHVKIHTGVRPYSCAYCEKTFADSSNRNKHVRRKHANVDKDEYIV